MQGVADIVDFDFTQGANGLFVGPTGLFFGPFQSRKNTPEITFAYCEIKSMVRRRGLTLIEFHITYQLVGSMNVHSSVTQIAGTQTGTANTIT
jgi:hypothetical protein